MHRSFLWTVRNYVIDLFQILFIYIAFRAFRMSDTTTQPTVARGRGRGKSRGGLGQYLRARGRGRGSGRPAEFSTRLVLEGEGRPSLTEEEEAELAKELAEKYSRRQLGTNADRYKEEEPELDSDGVFSSLSSVSLN